MHVSIAAEEKGNKHEAVFIVFSLRCLAGQQEKRNKKSIVVGIWRFGSYLLFCTGERTFDGFYGISNRYHAANSQPAFRWRNRGRRRMVFYSCRPLFKSGGKFSDVFIRTLLLRNVRPCTFDGLFCKGQANKRGAVTISAIFGACRFVVSGIMKQKERVFSASFTVEAAMVMAVVIWALGFVIRGAYIRYDEVTGSMILEEALENTRYSRPDEKTGMYYAGEGEKQGNPRLWLAGYRIMIEETGSTVKGKAVSGGWETQIELKRNSPERFLRRVQALLEERSRNRNDR